MAFKLAQNPSYTTPVQVFTPNDKGGFDSSTFKAIFKRCDMTELEALQEKEQIDVQRAVLVGFSDLLDEDDKELEFNETNVKALLAIPQARAALAKAFWASIFKAETKN